MKFLSWKFEPRDIWIGIYWTIERHLVDYPHEKYAETWCKEITLFICVIPCFPLQIRFYILEDKKK